MVDNNDDANNEHNEPTEHEDEFSEEFDFESEHGEDALGTEEFESHEEGEGEEGVEEQDIAPPKRKSTAIPVVIGLAVVGFIGWKIYGMFSTPKPSPIETAEKELPKEPVKIEPPPPAVVTPPAPPPMQKLPVQEAVPDEALVKLQKKIDEQEQLYKQQLSALERNLTAALQNSAETNKHIDSLQKDIASLSTAVQDLSSQLKTIRDEQLAEIAKQEERARNKHKAAKKLPKAAIASPTMSVHAIIPGRAWLRTADGKTVTVTEGDSVGEYGKILKIDAPNGVVVTSSGVVLR